ncbi:hypothetical protein DAA51_02785 [Bradyrhizobium sp. WBAH10]|nr:hypothetical protein DAA51_02785 [Bradyrhizobium sp. WBAH10]
MTMRPRRLKAEDVIQDLGVVRLLLELHQLIVHGVQALAGLRQKLPQQIIHELRLTDLGRKRDVRATLGTDGSPYPGSLDIPFHSPVNFILRATTDIEEKFAVLLHAAALFGKTASASQRREPRGQQADNCATRRVGKSCSQRTIGPARRRLARAARNRRGSRRARS